MRRIIVAVGLALVAEACSVLTNFDDLSGASIADAGDASSLDDGPSRVEASATDANAATDAGVRFCAAQPNHLIFCEDFDGEGGLSHLSITTTDSTAMLDDGAFQSPPESLHVTQADGGQTVSDIVGSSAMAPMFVRLEFDVSLASWTPGGDVAIGQIRLASSNNLTLTLGTGGVLILQENDLLSSNTTRFHPKVTFVLADGAWHHVELWIDLNAMHVGVGIDHATLQDDAMIAKTWIAGVASFRLGSGTESAPSFSADLHYDNVVLDSQ